MKRGAPRHGAPAGGQTNRPEGCREPAASWLSRYCITPLLWAVVCLANPTGAQEADTQPPPQPLPPALSGSQPIPVEPVPMPPPQPIPDQPIPGQPTPAQPIPTEPVPLEPIPAQPLPTPIPAVPPSVSIALSPPATPEYTISAADRALLNAVRRSILRMARDVENKQTQAAAYFADPNTVTATLRNAYDSAGASARGRYATSGMVQDPLQAFSPAPEQAPRPSTATGGDYFSADTQALSTQWTQAQMFYTSFAAALKNIEARLPARVGSTLWLWQYGQNPQHSQNNRGEVELSRELRQQLLREHRYLSHLKTQWDIWEERFTTTILPRHLAVYATALAQNASARQLAYGVQSFWDSALAQYHALYQSADEDEQQRLADEISDLYQRLGQPHRRYVACYLEPTAVINQRANAMRYALPPTPLNLPTYVADAFQYIPYDPASLAKAVAQLPPFQPRCALPTAAEQQQLAQLLADAGRQTEPQALLMDQLLCPECDDLRVELRALEMTLFEFYREGARLEDQLTDGPDANALRNEFLRLWRQLQEQAGALYASTQLKNEGISSPDDVGVSTLHQIWIAQDQQLRRYLSQNFPFTLIRAHLGDPLARRNICAEIRKFEQGKPSYPLYEDSLPPGEAIDPWSREQSCMAVPSPEQAGFEDLIDPEDLATPALIALAQQVRAAETRYHQRGLSESRLAQVQAAIQRLEKEREQVKARLERCLNNCRTRQHGG